MQTSLLSAQASRGSDPSQRQGQPVLQPRLPARAAGLGYPQLDVSQGQLLGQRSHREPVGTAEDGLWARPAVCHARAGKAGDHGLNRLLPPLAATFGFGLPQPDAVRTTLVGGAAQICRLRIRAMHSHFQGHPHVCYLVGCWPRAALLSARPGALTPRNLAILARSTHPGEVAEWSNAPDSKSGMRFSASRVRIPPSPPIGLTNQQVTLDLGISPTKRPKKKAT